MNISDGIVLLFEDKGWIPPFTTGQRGNPGSMIGNISPHLSADLETLITDLVLVPKTMRFGSPRTGTPLTTEMRAMLLAHKLRNEGAHSLTKQSIFVSKFDQIVKYLMFSIFLAIDAL